MTTLATRRDALIIGLVGALIGALIGVAVASSTPADAANGDWLVMGTKNTARNSTKIVSLNSTQFINMKDGRPAIKLEVRSGPPMAVNSSEKVEYLNVDLLDGLNAEGIAPIAAFDTRLIPLVGPQSGVDALSTTITIPGPGMLLMTASLEIERQDEGVDLLNCSFEVDDVMVPGSQMYVQPLKPATGDLNEEENCTTTGAIVSMETGTIDVDVRLAGLDTGTSMLGGTMWVLYVPTPSLWG